jgi:4-amino-4-deoxy-L-arabinose transferase-like glycosyltransferase
LKNVLETPSAPSFAPSHRLADTLLLLGVVAVAIAALFISVMDVDASQYASISMEMLQNGEWLQVQHRHADYLDKPPLLFWLSASSFGLFGLHTWAYKLPSLLALGAGVWAVFRFVCLFYPLQVAQHAAWILSACVGFFLLQNDVRTDSLLFGMTACAMWQVADYQLHSRWANLLWAGVLVGLAMLAKGPIGLVVPLVGLGSHVLLTGQWHELRRWQWWLIPAIALVVLAPMCWGLWQQFDLHPDKVINGKSGVSGLYFFFWEQSFGRVTGENVWQNDTSGFTFLHVYAWAFLPWTVLLVVALGRSAWAIARRQARLHMPEGYAVGALVIVFVALSQSQYKLPHYIFVTLPWAAVLTARITSGHFFSEKKIPYATWLRWTHFGVLVLSTGVAVALAAWVFGTTSVLVWLPVAVAGAAGLWWSRPTLAAPDWLRGGVAVAILIGWVLHVHFYPQLLGYQSTSEAGRYLRAQGIPMARVAFVGRSGHALDFYSQHLVNQTFVPEITARFEGQNGPLWLYIDAESRAELDRAGVRYSVVAEWGHFQSAMLTATFLNPATRRSALRPVALVRVDF